VISKALPSAMKRLILFQQFVESTPMHDQVIQTLYAAIDEVNEQLPDQRKLKKSPQTVLIGASSSVDSLTVVNLIVAVEQKIEEKYGVVINLAAADGLPGSENPFKDLETLVQHVSSLIGAARQ
jgi:acyl carrier protein